MPHLRALFTLLLCLALSPIVHAACPYDADCLNNP